MFASQVKTWPRSCVWFLLVTNLLLCQSQGIPDRFIKLRPDTLKEFRFFNCQGVFHKEHYSSLNRICDDCQNLFRTSFQVMMECKDNCFRNQMFETCVSSLLLDHRREEFKKTIVYLSGQDL